MSDRYGAVEDRGEVRKTERGESQEWRSHKDVSEQDEAPNNQDGNLGWRKGERIDQG